MKTALFALFTASLLALSGTVHAGSYGYDLDSYNYSNVKKVKVKANKVKVKTYRTAPYLVRTVELERASVCQTGYRPCGTPYHYYVTTVTYCDHYSDGSTHVYYRTFS